MELSSVSNAYLLIEEYQVQEYYYGRHVRLNLFFFLVLLLFSKTKVPKVVYMTQEM